MDISTVILGFLVLIAMIFAMYALYAWNRLGKLEESDTRSVKYAGEIQSSIALLLFFAAILTFLLNPAYFMDYMKGLSTSQIGLVMMTMLAVLATILIAVIDGLSDMGKPMLYDFIISFKKGSYGGPLKTQPKTTG